ncbi:hypothetical protein ELI56_04765 [Rhizobium ruizarguesonis]|jgi:hypothetical protein|nr:hypothetical protein [Rhizobium leguminosarum bv. viciae]TAT77556.1 hypothetical protein ELI56_04765 [Rhizobium ruizarguesonis]TAW08909.1 hypothetical protein ELI26_04615 [Rhizobium ruizarguesonis]TAW15207.1 hypothetical protein ELI25_04830 [Rhizobium ruizarguesonis]TAW20573.1 hypothetical protein ELI20_04790 [Rhizobium ruizarguesonis]
MRSSGPRCGPLHRRARETPSRRDGRSRHPACLLTAAHEGENAVLGVAWDRVDPAVPKFETMPPM